MEYMESIIPGGGGLNYDDDERVMQNADGRIRENVYMDTDGNYGNLIGLKGTVLCNGKGNGGGSVSDVTFIGSCKDYDNDAVISFHVVNDGGTYRNVIVRTVSNQSYQYILNEDIGWRESSRVQASVMDGKLYWAVDGNTYKANVERLWRMTSIKTQGVQVEYFDGSESVSVPAGTYVYVLGIGMHWNNTVSTVTIDATNGYQGNLTFLYQCYWDIQNYPEQIALIKQPPLSTVSVTSRWDETISENLLANGGMRFTYGYIYHDDEHSVYAAPSGLVASALDDTLLWGVFNVVDITLRQGNPDVKAIRVLVQNVATNTWYRVGDVAVADFNGLPTYRYEYTGASRQEVVLNDEVDKPFDSVPVEVESLAVVNNRVVLSNLTEGYDAVPVDMDVSVISGGGDVSLSIVDVQPYSLFSSDPKRFRVKMIVIDGIEATDVVPLGVRFTLSVRYRYRPPGLSSEDLYATAIVGTVESDAVKTMDDFRDEVMALYNSIGDIGMRSIDKDTVGGALNVWATYKTFADGETYKPAFYLIYGVRGELLLGTTYTLEWLESQDFDGIVSAGEYVLPGQTDLYTLMNPAYPTNGSSSLIYHREEIGIADFGTTYKTYGMYDVSLRYYDKYKRSVPAVNKTRVEIGGDYGVPKVLKLAIHNTPPDWAEYYSVCNSRCNITDSTGVELQGGGRITAVEGDPDGWFKEVSISGISPDDIGPDERLYWGVMRVNGGSSANYVVLAKNKDMASVYVHPLTNTVVALFRLRGISTVIYNDEPCWRVNMYEGTYVENYTHKTVRATGYIILSKSVDLRKFNDSRYAIPVMNTVEEKDGKFEHRFDIATYVNMLKKNLTLDKNVFVPKKDDYVRIIRDGDGVAKNVVTRVSKVDEGLVVAGEEDSFFSSYIIHLAPTETEHDLSKGGFVEFYRVSTVDTNMLYEEPTLRRILTFEGTRYHEGYNNVLVYNGDAYYRRRQSVGVNGEPLGDTYFVEEFRFSDVLDSKYWAIGRPHVVDADVKQVVIPVSMRHGGRLFEGTRINDSCRFEGANVIYLDSVDGSIQRVVPIGSQRMKVLQDSRSVTVDVGVAQRVSPDGTEEYVVSDRFFGSVRKSLNRWGTVNPEGVLEVNGNVYYFDARTSQLIRDGQNGQYPISGKVSMGEFSHDYKMHTYFKHWGDIWTAATRIAMGFDEENGLIYVTFRGAEDATVAYNEGANRWISSMYFTPRGYENVGRKLYSFDRQNIWKHNDGPRRFLYGGYRTVRIGMVFNSQPALMKLLDSIALKMRDVDVDALPNDFITINIHPSPSYPTGMRTYVTSAMLRLEENVYKSNIMRNVYTPDMVDEMDAFFDGEEMRGFSGTILLDFGASDVVFTLCEMGLSVSK